MPTYRPFWFACLLPTWYARYIVIGITGHRDLLDADKDSIKEAVQKKITELANGRPVLLVSALAKGADQWVAESVAEEPNVTLCVPLTMAPYDFVESGFTPEETDERGVFESARNNQKNVLVKLYQNSLYANGRERLTNRQRDLQYQKLGTFMARHCDHLLALWDGVDGGGVGGTSDVVRMMVKGRSLRGGVIRQKRGPQVVHQLVVPRQKNHFPLGRRFATNQLKWPPAAPYTWVISPVEAQRTSVWQWVKKGLAPLPIWYWVIGLGIGALAFVDSKKTFYPDQDLLTWGIIAALFALAGWAYSRFRRARELLLQFMLPLTLALLVLGMGTVGFYEGCLGNIVNSFFGAANLITLNASIFSELGSPEQPIIMNAWLKTARILGGFLAGYAFILAFALATGRENVGRFQFLLHRLFGRSFGVVLGGGPMAVDVAVDLAGRGNERVVLLADQVDATALLLLKSHRIWIMQGQITSRTALQKTHFWRAKEVYVVSESDEANFRCAQELDELEVMKKGHSDPEWYVHLNSGRQRALLQEISRQHLRTFSLNENTTRRLLLRHPIDRFTAGRASIAEVAILGFGPLGQELALACLRLGHYTPGHYLHITVYFHPDEQAAVDAFQSTYPILFGTGAAPFALSAYSQKVQQHTFFGPPRPAFDLLDTPEGNQGEQPAETHPPVIEFCLLPTAESELVHPNFPLYQSIQPGRAVSIYVCQPTGLESSALLNTLLPRIEWRKLDQPTGESQTDVQVFCYHNLPDPDEGQFVEMKLNGIAHYVPIVCFGDHTLECSVSAIKNESLSQLARQLALLYTCLYKEDTIESTELKELLASIKSEPPAPKVNNQAAPEQEKTFNQATIDLTKRLLPKLLEVKQTQLKKYKEWLDANWKSLKELDRESNSQAADHAWVKLRLIKLSWEAGLAGEVLSDEQLTLLGKVEHRRWNAEKLLNGWLPEPDKALWAEHKEELRNQKRHHLLMTFDQLEGDEKLKDHTQVLAILFFFHGLAAK